jgi:membrane protein DedA with SNARE-associated domain
MLASILDSLTDAAQTAGYPVVFAFVAIETMGIPLPGETALIVAGIAASTGKLSIELVIVLAAAAAIIGDNVGFLLGRHYGRRVVDWDGGPFPRQRKRLLEVGEPFFEKHGPKAVFLGRWVAGLRIASSWLAGINHMKWSTFTFWNALGGICWAVSVGLLAYFLGNTAKALIEDVGYIGLAVGVVAAAGVFWFVKRREHAAFARAEAEADARAERPPDGD